MSYSGHLNTSCLGGAEKLTYLKASSGSLPRLHQDNKSTLINDINCSRSVMTETKAKVVLFYKNGDRHFSGYHVSITPRRFKNFENLLAELTRVTKLPLGVRFIFTPDTGECVTSLDQLEDGKSYVCSSHQKLKKISYGAAPDGLERKIDQKVFVPVPNRPPMQLEIENQNNNTNLKPKIITVIRYGSSRPRKAVKILLNKRTAQTFDQVLNDITSSVGVSGGFGIRKIFSAKGKLILSLSELFSDGEVFVAVGSEKFHPSDLYDILQEHGFGKAPADCILNYSSSESTRLKCAVNQPLWRRSEHCNISKRLDMEDMENGIKLETQMHSRSTFITNAVNGCISECNSNMQLNSHSMLPSISNTTLSQNKVCNQNTLSPQPGTASQVKPYGGTGNGAISNQAPVQELELRAPGKPGISSDEAAAGRLSSRSAIPVRVVGSRQNSLHSPSASPTLPIKRSVNNAVTPSLSNGSLNGQNQALLHSGGSDCGQMQYFSACSAGHGGSPFATAKDHISYFPSKKIASSQDINLLFEVGKQLGDGNFAVVKLAKNKITREDIALKIIDRRKLAGKEVMLENEIFIQRSCSHPNICVLYGDIHSPDKIFLVLELVTGGDYFDLIANSVKFEEPEAAGYIRDICRALEYLHEQSIVHRDLKPENLMVFQTPSGGSMLKLVDFGLAMKVTEPIFTVCGTPTYVAPEILTEEGYGIEVDVWAAGVIMYISLCGFPPFRSAERRQSELFDLIESGEFEFLAPYWDDVSNEAKDLLSHVLVVSRRKRFKAGEILQHVWMTENGAVKNNPSGDSAGTAEDSPIQQHGVSRLRAAALTVLSVERMKHMVDLHVHRGEELISVTNARGSSRSNKRTGNKTSVGSLRL